MQNRKLRTLLLAGGMLASGMLISATAEAGPSDAMLSNTCAGCHGTNGVSAGPAMPSIAGLNASYLTEIMKEYRSGDRHSTIMGRVAKGYDDGQIEQMAKFFAGQKWANAKSGPNSLMATAIDKKKAKHGKKLAKKCGKCHEENGVSQVDDMPRMAGQWLDYLLIKMEDYKNRDDILQPKKMKKQIGKLNAKELEAVAHFYANQK